MQRKSEQSVRRFFSACAVIALALSQSGCYLRPNWGSPGTIGAQAPVARTSILIPTTDLGPPVVSGRPLGFERPLSEPEQNQYDLSVFTGWQSSTLLPGSNQNDWRT
jgi:hypothetical protein